MSWLLAIAHVMGVVLGLVLVVNGLFLLFGRRGYQRGGGFFDLRLIPRGVLVASGSAGVAFGTALLATLAVGLVSPGRPLLVPAAACLALAHPYHRTSRTLKDAFRRVADGDASAAAGP